MQIPLYLEIADQIELSIKESSIPQGSKLGSERDLAQQYHVSRNVIRQAMHLLSEKGLVELRSGKGAFVANPNDRFMEVLKGILISNQNSFLQNLEVREVLEKAIIVKVIPFLSDEKIAHLESICERMDKLQHSKNPADYVYQDVLFHESIAKCIPNPLFHLLLQMFYSLEHNNSFLITKSSKRMIEDAQREHREIMDSLMARDPDRALQAMEAHMRNVRNDLISLS